VTGAAPGTAHVVGLPSPSRRVRRPGPAEGLLLDPAAAGLVAFAALAALAALGSWRASSAALAAARKASETAAVLSALISRGIA
jgi:hypothetical protein